MKKSILFFLLAAHFTTDVNAQYEWKMNSAGRYVYVKTVTVDVNSGTKPSNTRTTETTTSSKKKYDNIVVFSENLASVSKNGKNGFIDEYDKLVIPFSYDYADNFFNGRALVKLNGKYGFIDKNGTIIIPLEYDKAERFESYTTKVEKGNQRYEIDRNGRTVATQVRKYSYQSSYSEGLALVYNINGKYGYIDIRGYEIIPLMYENGFFFKNGKAKVKLNGKWGCIDKNGKTIVPFLYDRVIILDNLVEVELNDKWGVYDSLGKMLAAPEYDEMHSFNEGMAAVKLDKKWGYIDSTGQLVIPLKYDATKYLGNGIFDVTIKNKNGLELHGLVNRNDKILLPPIYSIIVCNPDGSGIGFLMNGGMIEFGKLEK